jgi:DNA processing protein
VDDLDLGYLMAVAAALVWTPRPLRSWLDALGDPRAMVERARSGDAPPDGAEPLGAAALCRLAAVDDAVAARALSELAESSARVLTDTDASYPSKLRDLCDPPPVLYVRGNEQALEGRAVAVVGSRAATSYGRNVAGSMPGDLCRFGACIISGLARGIDACAHKGALDASAPTVAVIGSGFSALYPPYHSLLADEIVGGGGALLSEFPPSMPARAHHFPMRNRVVAALAQATVVVEAGERSGALITARLADEIGRVVCAVPGDVGRAASAGTNALIKDGVPLVTSGADVAELLGWRAAPAKAFTPEADEPLVALMDASGSSIEELSDRLHLEVGSVLARLTLLELQGAVLRLPGGLFAPVKHARLTDSGIR